ncbi:MAG: GNAT family protein [Bacillota bacterium]|nr:GNAT family protein [Bacillota bacterium]
MPEAMRVTLDAVRPDDLPLFARWFRDPGLLALLNPGPAFPGNEEDEQEWYRRMREARAAGREYTFAIRLLDSGRPIGSTTLRLTEPKNRLAEYGIAVADPEARGRGYGLEATRLVLRYGFDELNLHRIELRVFAFNQRAYRMYLRAGFREEGRRREALFRDGRYHDAIWMAILEEEWRAQPHEDLGGWIPPEAG